MNFDLNIDIFGLNDIRFELVCENKEQITDLLYERYETEQYFSGPIHSRFIRIQINNDLQLLSTFLESLYFIMKDIYKSFEICISFSREIVIHEDVQAYLDLIDTQIKWMIELEERVLFQLSPLEFCLTFIRAILSIFNHTKEMEV